MKSWLKVDEKRTEVNPTVRTVTDIHLRDLIGLAYNEEQTGAQIASTCPEPVSNESVLKEADSYNPQLSKDWEVEETISSGGLEWTSNAVWRWSLGVTLKSLTDFWGDILCGVFDIFAPLVKPSYRRLKWRCVSSPSHFRLLDRI